MVAAKVREGTENERRTWLGGSGGMALSLPCAATLSLLDRLRMRSRFWQETVMRAKPSFEGRHGHEALPSQWRRLLNRPPKCLDAAEMAWETSICGMSGQGGCAAAASTSASGGPVPLICPPAIGQARCREPAGGGRGWRPRRTDRKSVVSLVRNGGATSLGKASSTVQRRPSARISSSLRPFNNNGTTVSATPLPTLAHSPSVSPPSWRGSSADSTPITTPIIADYSYPHQQQFKQHPLAQRRCLDDGLTSDDLLFPHDDPDESNLPLFPIASPPPSAFKMSGTASPIDIATSRQTSTSPRNQQSNLTSQLQRPVIDVKREDIDDEAPDDIAPLQKGRQESISMLGTTPHGARTIPGRDGMMRRESTTNGFSNSLMGGMSWGGISMNNFLHDDIMMAGTSPYGFQSPSFHSSSYLPKMEANYMKDYVCCDIKLDSMHELLQHYEEAHAAQPNQTIGRTPKELQFPSTRAANAASTAQAVQQQAQAQQANLANQMGSTQNAANPSPLFSGQSGEQLGTFDNLDSMDMDDNMLSQPSQQQGAQFQPQPNFGRQQPRGTAVNVNLAAAFQGQGLNSSGTTTPHASHQAFQNNPTVSSVNTPNLNSQSSMSQQALTPDSSIPNSPAPALNLDYTNQLDLNSLDYAQLMQGNSDFNTLNLNGTNNLNGGSSGTIDDPAKRLLSKQGYANHSRFGNAQVPNSNNNNSELAKRLREQQLLNGLAGAGGFVGEEIKPFKCPVIGCEKAYKNQNGLKYHKQHGHQNQQLKENADGTFSIVDPTTSIPYPGTVGMEKEKPYRCEVCGKRYKNLNGLKYHRQHSPPCNPDLVKPNPGMVPGGLQGMGVNVAGAGLLGMSDGMGY